MSLLKYTLLFAAVAVFTAVVSRILRKLAMRNHWLDMPSERSLHEGADPQLGGLVIVFVVLSSWFLVAGFQSLVHQGWVEPWAFKPLYYDIWDKGILAMMCGGFLVALAGFLNQRIGVSRYVRFAIHIVAACIVIWAYSPWFGWDIPLLENLWPWSNGKLAPLIGVIWIVGMTNGYRFMDGIDGLGALQGIVAGVAWFAIGLHFDIGIITFVGLLVAASSLGFLTINLPPAKLSMGEAGSSFLGFITACIPLVAAGLKWEPRLTTSMIIGFLILWPFILDTFETFLYRLVVGESLGEPHRGHLYQRFTVLFEGSRGHLVVGLTYFFLSIMGACFAYFVVVLDFSLILAFVLCGVVWITVRIAYISKAKAAGMYPGRGGEEE